MNNWFYNEYKHRGVDYADSENVKIYDDQHQKFRNYEKEFLDMLAFLDLKEPHNQTVIDLGCGTGASTIFLAERFKKVYAVDVSPAMLEQAKKKCTGLSNNNIEFIQAGFLSYKHQGDPVDLLITKAAFHHLPDFWKQIALLHMNRMLHLGGHFYLFDIVFHFVPTQFLEKIDGWVSGFEKSAGRQFKEEVEVHIRDEFSTFKWILDGMIEKAGFQIEKCRSNDGFVTEYHCIKAKDL
jgi:putative AdoMet-dependent methyltransferase